VLTINGAWKPNMHEAMQLHLKLVGKRSFVTGDCGMALVIS